MSLTASLGRMAANAALPLTVDAVLSRGAASWPIRAITHRQRKPARAGHTGGDYDAMIRVHGPDLPTQILQNDTITLQGAIWIVWRLSPSTGGASVMVEAMAPPAEAVTPLAVIDTPDGYGGTTQEDSPLPSILAKIHGISAEKALTSSRDDTLNRLVMSWPYNPAETEISAGGRVDVRGLEYTIKSVGLRDDNPTWRRAVLARET